MAKISKSFGGVRAVVDFTLEVREGEFLVLLGPSGCGKTTLIRMVSGLEEPDSGRIVMGEEDWTLLPPQERNVAMVFQRNALYPHRTVRGNIDYPLKLRRISTEERQRRVEAMAAKLDLSRLLERRPYQLSGGEAQRVALARALVRQPSCFLMDEPLSSLDPQLRLQARTELRRVQREADVTTIHVTHDQDEAVALGDRIAIMNEGSLVQVGEPDQLFDEPRNVFVATFLGTPPMNLLRGKIAGWDRGLATVLVSIGDRTEALSLALPGTDPGELILGFRPGALSLSDPGTVGDGVSELVIPGVVASVQGVGGDYVAHCGTAVGAVAVRASVRSAPGAVAIRFPLSQAHYFNALTGERLRTLGAKLV